MIKCPFCGTNQVANTIFCSECGVYLLEDERRGTEALDVDPKNWSDETANEVLAAWDKKKSGTIVVRLKIGEKQREVETTLVKSVHLGRLDPASDVFPEVDLTNDDGLGKGVSRRHARILKRDNHVVVEDLGSINGTFVNGKRLAPYIPEPLNDGDQLQVGTLMIEVSLG